ncbi:hypothetical protein KY290_011746 [Solanum tuberosum]|uniref:Uncharacterized protein n=1 Tax=Solanum tuberosum TaxID=4113 RepID=A0ABQ7W1J4_SOLTU|nr:hypothetical protein KY285_025107 [Solanum tuberosum]KAH0774609.1 hypothetical protein KY290_011746 [Solanum tuberosum]
MGNLLRSAHDSWNHSFACRSLGFVLLLLFRGVKTGFRLFLFEKEEVTGQAKEMPKEQMLLFETKALAETYLPLKNTIDNGVREALKKSDRARKKERIKTSWAARKRRERIARIVLRPQQQENNKSTSSQTKQPSAGAALQCLSSGNRKELSAPANKETLEQKWKPKPSHPKQKNHQLENPFYRLSLNKEFLGSPPSRLKAQWLLVLNPAKLCKPSASLLALHLFHSVQELRAVEVLSQGMGLKASGHISRLRGNAFSGPIPIRLSLS